MAMKVLSDESPYNIFRTASGILREAVNHTLGPKGMNTAVCTNSSGVYQIINDGKAIIQDITADDPILAPAIESLKQSCFETNRVAGDGTTSTIIMTNELLSVLEEFAGVSISSDARRELEESRDKLLKAVDTFAVELTEDKYEDVATVALGGSKYAKILADAYKFVGKEGSVAFIKEDRKDVVLECQNGVTLDKISLPIIPVKEPRELFDLPTVFVYERIDRFADIVDILNKSIEYKGKKTLFFYNEMSWDASSNIYANIGSGNIDIIPIRLGGYGTNTRDVMQQLSDYCGCKMIDGFGVKLSNIPDLNEVYGRVNKSLVSDSKVVLCTENILQKSLNYSLQLSDKSCIIKIGGNNSIEQEETYRRIEDAVSSLKTAIKDGIVNGGGTAYIRAYNIAEVPSYLEGVCWSIYKTVVKNTTGENAVKSEQFDYECFGDNVFDSVTVIKEVIRNSFSLVAQIITTKKLVCELIR